MGSLTKEPMFTHLQFKFLKSTSPREKGVFKNFLKVFKSAQLWSLEVFDSVQKLRVYRKLSKIKGLQDSS